MPEEARENFVIQTPEHVAEAEAGMHTLASPGAGLGLSGSDIYGLSGEAKGQFRIVAGRFVRQPLPMVGLCIFVLLGLGSVLVGHFWQFNYQDITNNLNDPRRRPTPSAPTPSATTCSPRSWPGCRRTLRSPSPGRHRGADRRDHRRHRRLLPGLGGFTPDALRRPRPGGAHPGHPHPALVASWPSSRATGWGWPSSSACSRGPTSPGSSGRISCRCANGFRRGCACARGDESAHHCQAHAAERHRADHRQRHADGGAEHHARIDPVVPRTRRPAAQHVAGLLVAQGQDSATTEWWLFVFPVALLIILILSINFIGDGLREAFDPRRVG